jgi:hypothetical protein
MKVRALYNCVPGTLCAGATFPGLYCTYSGRGKDLLAIPYADVLLLFVGETTELCKWTVDLGSLPPFQQFAQSQQGFYTGSCSLFHPYVTASLCLPKRRV